MRCEKGKTMSARSPGDKRRREAKRERERVAYEAAMALLRAAGRSCASCAHFERVPTPFRNEWHCSIESDFHVYAVVKASHLCPKWKAKRVSAGETTR